MDRFDQVCVSLSLSEAAYSELREIMYLAYGDEDEGRLPTDEQSLRQCCLRASILMGWLPDQSDQNIASLLVLFEERSIEDMSALTVNDYETILSTIISEGNEDDEEVGPETDKVDREHIDISNAEKMQENMNTLLNNLQKERGRQRFLDEFSAGSFNVEEAQALEQTACQYIDDKISDLHLNLKEENRERGDLSPVNIHARIEFVRKQVASLETAEDFNVDQLDVLNLNTEDEISMILTKLRDSQNDLVDSVYDFREQLLLEKDRLNAKLSCVTITNGNTAENNDDDNIHHEKNVDLGWHSSIAARERDIIDDQISGLVKKKEKMMADHKAQMNEIMEKLRRCTFDQFNESVRSLYKDRETITRAIENVIDDKFKSLKDRSEALKGKYDGIYSKATSSVRFQFEKSRKAFYESEGYGDDIDKGGPHSHKNSISATGEDINTSEGAEDGKNESEAHLLLPWKVMLDRDLSRFHREVHGKFDDTISDFIDSCKQIESENEEKLAKYLK